MIVKPSLVLAGLRIYTEGLELGEYVVDFIT